MPAERYGFEVSAWVDREHYAALRNDVDRAIASAVSAERERCALIADNAAFAMSPGPLYSAGFVAAKQFIAGRIRGNQ